MAQLQSQIPGFHRDLDGHLYFVDSNQVEHHLDSDGAPMKEARQYLRLAVEALDKLNPQPGTNPGPLASESERAYEMRALALQALGWSGRN